MIRVACDGCLEDIDLADGYIGLDEYLAPDEDEYDEDPVNDEDYGFHFHDAGCVWAWSMARVAEVVDG